MNCILDAEKIRIKVLFTCKLQIASEEVQTAYSFNLECVRLTLCICDMFVHRKHLGWLHAIALYSQFCSGKKISLVF